MKTYYAHSPKDGFPAQRYQEHIEGVLELVRQFAGEVAKYAVKDGKLLFDNSEPGAFFHDLGKLDEQNQSVLSGEVEAGRLPINHADAGAAYLLDEMINAIIPAIVVYSHHKGLPNFSEESIRGESMFRNPGVKAYVDDALKKYVEIHHNVFGDSSLPDTAMPIGDMSIYLRLVLSILVDGDHTNTAMHYGKYPKQLPDVKLKPLERLDQLDNYVSKLGDHTSERSQLRTKMYEDCRNAEINDPISFCDSPVGTGKTTAVMAHLLAQASKRGLRRIFVVLPFTNIIEQSVRVYRECLVLPGEKPEEVVAELHHRADFENKDLRHLTALWRAPIIVTTAVAFFETLASNRPSSLRRLHELPGSAIFVDEAHAALPASLLPIAWRWIERYADEWTCYWVLASGSLNKFWQIEEIAQTPREIPSIVSEPVRNSLSQFEVRRIEYKKDLTPKSIDGFCDWINQSPGPRIVILNTIQSAAVIANRYKERFGQECVEHMSTALLSNDRETTLERVKERLKSPTDVNWTLVATSCVEAGVDFSFRTGFRELASLTSLLQASGRVNRSGEYGIAEMNTFFLAENKHLKSNPGLKNAASVLRDFIEEDISIEPILTTRAISRELKMYGSHPMSKKMLDNESNKNFLFVNDNFRVIDGKTSITVVDKTIANEIRSGYIDWQSLQQNSIQIADYKLQKLGIPKISEEIYQWNLGYDDFLGYMAGVLDVLSFEDEDYIM